MTSNAPAHPEQNAQTKVSAPSALIALESATEDLENVSDVYSWLAHLFFEIGEQCKKNDPSSAALSLLRIQTMADMGNYLAVNWTETSASMRRSAIQVLNEIAKAEANHG